MSEVPLWRATVGSSGGGGSYERGTPVTSETLEQEMIDEAPLNGVVAFTELVLRRMGTYKLNIYSEGLSVCSQRVWDCSSRKGVHFF